ncbi:MNIO family bufferin maturase [Legionella tunisiensis]|uniref:MNIO family bufferin maturase n=1 Tax=Legionella tunisiensis TaxID=1034944 RepID=UPI000301E155|nr:DUF692 family multinuclear iron-containing protein [Legionella tunisiensis]
MMFWLMNKLHEKIHPMIGIGLRAPHYYQIVEEKPGIDWLEVHTENFMFSGGPLLDLLFSIRQHYPLSFHGIGLSLGSAQGISKEHLKRIKILLKRFEPFLLSDHLSWSSTEYAYLPDLLPIPYNKESLTVIANNIDDAQNYLQRTLLIENPSSYIEFQTSTYPEAEFLAELVKRTGAKILLDITNIFVSCFNHGWNPHEYIQAIPHEAVQEIHLAGHSVHVQDEKNSLLIDTHDDYVCQDVWELYRYAIKYTGIIPTLLEWDAAIPDLKVLLNEAKNQLTMSTIKQIQQDFHESVLDRKSTTMINQIRHNQITPEFRFSVYRNTILQNLRHALELTFPAIWQLVGKECADSLAWAFVQDKSNLPVTNCLDDWGEKFPQFLQTIKPIAHLSYLKDIAQLEWLRHLSLYAANYRALSPIKLQQYLDNYLLEDLRLILNPTVFLYTSPYSLKSIFDLIDATIEKEKLIYS